MLFRVLFLFSVDPHIQGRDSLPHLPGTRVYFWPHNSQKKDLKYFFASSEQNMISQTSQYVADTKLRNLLSQQKKISKQAQNRTRALIKMTAASLFQGLVFFAAIFLSQSAGGGTNVLAKNFSSSPPPQPFLYGPPFFFFFAFQ